MEKRDVDLILEEIRAVHRSVHDLIKQHNGDKLPDEGSYQESLRVLVDFHLVRGWLQDAGLSSYEIGLALQNTLAGTFVLNSIIEGLKAGAAVAVRAIREESDTAIEAVNNWVAAEEVVQAIGAGEKPSVKEGAEQFENVFAERARLYEARADALEADDSPDADAEEIIRKAAFLRGRAREAMEFAQLVLQTVKH